MKVWIGKYPSWFGPYQLADLLQYVGVSKNTCEKIAEKIPSKPFEWFQKVFQNGGERRSFVSINSNDTYSLDHTLALIICPALKALKKDDCSAFFSYIDKEDYPDHIEWTESDESHEEAYKWLIDELIWTFEAYLKDDYDLPQEERDTNRKRKTNGLRLFGKYYENLWW